jgi:hypothetical protein
MIFSNRVYNFWSSVFRENRVFQHQRDLTPPAILLSARVSYECFLVETYSLLANMSSIPQRRCSTKHL